METQHLKDFDKNNVKNYSDVKVGDTAHTSHWAGGIDDIREIGEVLYIGKASEIRNSKYSEELDEWENEEGKLGDEDYDLIIVEDGFYGPVLFNYNNDPCGCIVLKK